MRKILTSGRGRCGKYPTVGRDAHRAHGPDTRHASQTRSRRTTTAHLPVGTKFPRTLGALVVVGTTLAACGSSDSDATSDRVQIVVTTNVLGDIVTKSLGDLVGTAVDIEVIIPLDADPHEFSPSARQAETMENADILVANGLGLEEALEDAIDNGVGNGATSFNFGGTFEGGADVDPHIWLDPILMADAITSFGAVLTANTTVDAANVAANIESYVEQLQALDAVITAALSDVAPEDRLMVTNHEALGYFAARYGFEILGTVIPSVSTSAAPSAAGLEQLAALIRDSDVPAIFAETTESDRLAQALADEVGNDVAVVELYTESLGAPGSDADSYIGFMTINAQRIAAALG